MKPAPPGNKGFRDGERADQELWLNTLLVRTVRWLLVLFALVAGFVASRGGGPAVLAQPAGSAEAFRRTTLHELPWDAAMIVSASVLAMRGRDMPQDPSPVTLTQAAKTGLTDSSFRYEGFTLTGFVLTGYGASTAFTGAISLSAVLTFADATGRRAAATLIADYGAATPGLEIKAADIVILPPQNPEVRLFIAPARDVPDSLFASNVGQLDLLRHVAARALTHEAAKRLPSTPEDLYVFAFFQDRLPPDTEVQLRVSETPEGIGGDPSFSATMDFDGWRVATMRAKFALNSGTEFFIKAIYRPGIPLPAAERTPRLVGLLSSHLKSTGK